MSLQVYPPVNIINIIVNEFFLTRNIEIVDSRSYTDDEIISDMEKYGFVRIDHSDHCPSYRLGDPFHTLVAGSESAYCGKSDIGRGHDWNAPWRYRVRDRLCDHIPGNRHLHQF